MESAAVEDYLKTIYSHTEWQAEPITPSVLATKLGIAPSSVTQMVNRLVAARLVERVPYGPLTLTDAGRSQAAAVVRKHRLIETWLMHEMEYSWDAVHDEAEVLEHAISDRLLEAIDVRLGRPERDPHGDAIPRSDGSVRHEPAVVLADAAPGHVGAILRISDRDPGLLRELAANGIGVGSEVTVSASHDAASVSVRGCGVEVSLDAAAAQAIWLSK